MRNETEVRSRVLVSECGDGRSEVHHTGDHCASLVAELAVVDHHVLAVLHNSHVDMETRTSLSCCDLRSECHVETHTVCYVSDHPLCDHELVSALLTVDRQELDLALLINVAVHSEVAYLRVTIFDLSAGS